ncbi:hypothetical protein GCM10010168_26370 [Actinoplanes ianthinogenes]|uniref:Uncharacterized protein n=1 Tax=Actinoplanes ianthinogenes TaxID=122358 RepID=A0ABN6CT12_9ACTN|nr:CU044_5270 family protein [Actinoplanes ianthinogenes]BCJ48277.1 hypothetical protein Aiant_89340 [Actinoplanes ianthinogenes]GGR07633.1 hypothetical protein GCM10010168_26370 [Actinoplanes ianthinogenes]
MIDELDVALNDLYPVPAEDPEALRRVRVRVLKRKWPRVPLAAAAAVILAVAVAVVAIRGRTPDGAMVLVAQTLNTAADAPIQAVDEPVPAGKYRYIAVHSMAAVFQNSDLGALRGVKQELWVPAERAGEWFRLETDTGERVPLLGTAEQLTAAGFDDRSAPIRETGPCGAFGPGISDMCTAKGTWQVPTAAFVAGLPRDPRKLFDRLRDDTDGRGRDADQEVLVYVADALRSGLIPADLRSALYRALAYLPTLKIVEERATLDGRTGTALGIAAAGERLEVIIDPVTGLYIGERTRRTTAARGLPAGTLIQSSSVAYGVAEAPWKPAGHR